ncbi:Oligoribonuclease, mitochondrial [Orchesella cincta]|uniref:Oligoribonuclease, mitochondrial n=1 Tax=Orchesella cincta TaxID=48709 RepID=A0A1D2MNB8_ORCCI|nr:Oligoribonuclease, mitochondrial [Orchesella cincta]
MHKDLHIFLGGLLYMHCCQSHYIWLSLAACKYQIKSMQTRMIISCGSLLKSVGRSGACEVLLKGDFLVGFGKTGFRAFCQTRPKLKELKSTTEIVQGWVKSVVAGTSSSSSARVEDSSGFLKRSEGKPIDYVVKLEEALARKHRKLTTGRRMYSHSPMDDKIVWVDCEMTSLETDGQLMEIGVIITGPNLEEIARHESTVFKIEDSVLDSMGDWCKEHHGKSGLTDSCRKSTITHSEADDKLLEFLLKYTTPRECPIAGNSIGIDRIFIAKQLPKVYAHLHYRSIDVSSIKELARRWYPAVMDAAPKKRWSHRVLDDIEDSIAELKYYRSAVFVEPKATKVPQSGNVQRTKAKDTAV